MRNYYNAKLSNDLNKTVLTLTVATIFLSIPTLIGSIYGMNIPLPHQNKESLIYFLVLLIAIIWGTMFFGLKKLKVF
jgi:magnesium transporter